MKRAPLHLARRGQGPALVLLHGYTGRGSDLASLAAPFATRPVARAVLDRWKIPPLSVLPSLLVRSISSWVATFIRTPAALLVDAWRFRPKILTWSLGKLRR